MNRNVVACALVVSVVSLSSACSSEEPATTDNGGSGGGGAGGSGTGGTAGSETGGTATGGATGGSATGGSATGGSATGGSATGGSATGGGAGRSGGGQSGSSGAGGMAGGAGAGGAGVGGAGAGGAGVGGAGGAGGGGGAAGGAHAMMNFFVTSDTDMDGNLGGLAMADMRCQTLATAVGHGSKTWRAYLSVAEPMTHAINRIGEGPYYNSAGAMVAMTKAALHERNGDAMLFIDERGNRINGQWTGSPTPNHHDILTGSQRNGMLSTGNTCSDWTATTGNAQVGHSDGLGPGMSMEMMYPYWTGSHNAPCGNLAQTGGAGKLYCFVGP